MRITAGQWRGRKLAVPDGDDVRPTSDMVRQAIFNILLGHGHPQGAFVLDAFCGTGALGLEAMSRGAAHGFFMDNDKTSLAFTRRNVINLGADPATILDKDALNPGPFTDMVPATLVFLDPPYRKGMVAGALTALAARGWIDAGAVCVAECEKELAAFAPPGFTLLDDRTYGGTRVVFLRRDG